MYELSGVKNVTLLSYKQLRIATDEFSPVNKIGEGGFGSVYKCVNEAFPIPQRNNLAKAGESKVVAGARV
ncbi:hypothetical protein P3L10_001158 [Capsicum annuum]